MPTIVEVTTHTHFPIKLTTHNFPVWRKQVIATLTRLGLDGYVNGSTAAPSKVLSTDNTKSNPAYLPWFRQDQIILGALLGSCSETIQPIVSSAETTHEAFKSPVDEEDLIVHILSQLGEEYTHISSALKIRDTPITFPDLFDKLVDHERTLKDTQSPPVIATVNNTQKHSNRYPPRSNYDNRNSNRFNNSNNSITSHPPGQHNGSNNYQRCNRNSTYYQYCNITGHDTKECRKLARFFKENNITIFMNSPANPMVNTTSANSTSATPSWMFDSGASHHVASNPASFHTLSEYGGPNEIVLGNGTGLSISHTGHSSLPTSSRLLHLHNILFVPQLRNNLIFVAKLCKSNNVSVEFFPSFFLVKDLRTGAILMRGVNINDIYYAAICSLHNGGEFIKLATYLQQHGISHFTTPPHTPEQNGIAERRHRHIVETGLSLLHHANLPLTFCTHAFQTTVHLINRLPTPILYFKSPYDKLHNTPPTYQKLKHFGCLCYP
ncbi:hypothetical protein LXL04_018277 [Taraxacum kok-saghyz]